MIITVVPRKAQCEVRAIDPAAEENVVFRASRYALRAKVGCLVLSYVLTHNRGAALATESVVVSSFNQDQLDHIMFLSFDHFRRLRRLSILVSTFS